MKTSRSGLKENQRLVADEPVKFEEYPVEVGDFVGELPIILEESMEEYTSNE